MILDTIAQEKRLPEDLKERALLLKEQGIIEKVGRKYILSRGFYDFIGQKGTYTRKRGLDREHNKVLLLKHITDNADTGSPLHELCQVLPNLNERQVRDLVYELNAEGKIKRQGVTRTARWKPS